MAKAGTSGRDRGFLFERPAVTSEEEGFSSEGVPEFEFPEFVSPGIDYVLHVQADNIGLSGEKTDAVNWKIWSPFYQGTWDEIPGINISLGGPNNNGAEGVPAEGPQPESIHEAPTGVSANNAG